MAKTELSDNELIETFGGGYGQEGIVNMVREFLRLKTYTNLPYAFSVAAKQRGLKPSDEIYQPLLRAVARELGGRQKSANTKKAPPKTQYVFRGEVLTNGEGHQRYCVNESYGSTVVFVRSATRGITWVSVNGRLNNRLLQAAQEYAEKHWVQE